MENYKILKKTKKENSRSERLHEKINCKIKSGDNYEFFLNLKEKPEIHVKKCSVKVENEKF